MTALWNPVDLLTKEQRRQLEEYLRLLLDLNRRVNLISREDQANAFEHHILHSLMLTWRCFPAGATVVDWGTGGGLPAIPLAIAFPAVRVIAVDAVEKKVQAVRSMARRLGLTNLAGWHGRAEAFSERADFSVSRATAPLEELWSWHIRVAEPGHDEPGCWRRGLICLKGGDLADEIASARASYPDLGVRSFPIRELQSGAYFQEKRILECRESDEPTPDQDR